MSFDAQKILIFDEVQFIYIFVVACIFVVYI